MDIFKPILNIVWFFTKKNDQKRIAGMQLPEGITACCDIPYLDDGEKGHLLDIYYPQGAEGKLPLIIDIHGGGWMYGYKEINKHYCFELAKRGYCVASLNYRLADKVMFIDQLSDIFDAFHWIEEQMEPYPADLDSVFLTGDSAGGQFACLSAAINLDSALKKKYGLTENALNFKCVGATSPVIDMLSFQPILNANLTMLLGNRHKASDCYPLMKFSNIATKNLPPFYIATSSGDFVQKQSILLHSLLDELQVENTLHNWRERYQGKKLPHVFSVIDPFSLPGKTIIDEMTDFFAAHAETRQTIENT